MRILISGFPKFSTLSKNPSEELLKLITTDKHIIRKILIPVVWEDGYKKLEKEIKDFNPDIIFMLGAAGRNMYSFESMAINKRDIKSIDNNGLYPKSEYVIDNGPEKLLSTFDPNIFKYCFDKCNIESYISNDCGTYLCNETLYNCLYYNKNIRSIFIHLPTKLDLDEVLKLGIKGFNQVFDSL